MSQQIEPLTERMIREGTITPCRHGFSSHVWCGYCEKNKVVAEPFEKRVKKREGKKRVERKKGFATRSV